ncbi:hypothetical protein NHG85_12040, partial [Limimaricola sp. ASW11-118]
AEVARLVEARGLTARCVLRSDPALAPGDARVAWEGGQLDYSFAAICDEILDTLRAIARAHPETEDRT